MCVCVLWAVLPASRPVNAERFRHADFDTEACRRLRTMATGVAEEMVQLLHRYLRVISVCY